VDPVLDCLQDEKNGRLQIVGFSAIFLHTASSQKLEVEMVWE